MHLSVELNNQHQEVTRRYFIQLGAAGALAFKIHSVQAETNQSILDSAMADMSYLTAQADFGTVERGDPLPYKLPLAKRLKIGLERESWKLDVIADPNSNGGNSFSFSHLMKLADKHAVRYLKIMTCNNIGAPLGMGLWRGSLYDRLFGKQSPKRIFEEFFIMGIITMILSRCFEVRFPLEGF